MLTKGEIAQHYDWKMNPYANFTTVVYLATKQGQEILFHKMGGVICT